MTTASDEVILWAIVAARILVPLAIPRWPLPAILTCMVIDGMDKPILEATDLDLTNYQSYDKALDIYYLAIAYTATLRNWTNLTAFGVGRFLYYFRLSGNVLFELTQMRALLFVFANVFEFFFQFYEAVRVRWDPARLSRRVLLGAMAFIWICIKLPQEWWIHVAQLDATDAIKTHVFGVAPDARWSDAIAANRAAGVGIVAALAVLGAIGWWFVTRRLPPADRPPTFDADARQPRIEPAAIERERRRMAERLFDRDLMEKIVLVSLLGIILGRMLPGIQAAPLGVAVGVGIVIVASTATSEWFIRRGRTWDTLAGEFAVMLLLNVGIVYAGQLLMRFLRGDPFEHALVFVLLLTLIVTFFDRYRPVHLARFAP